MEKAHKKLKVWQEAMKLVGVVYQMTEQLPENEKFGLISQMRRAAISIPSNILGLLERSDLQPSIVGSIPLKRNCQTIAEGAARQGSKEAVQFYTIGRGSLSELDTQVELCRDLKLLSPSNISLLTSHLNTVDALLSGFIRYKKEKIKDEKQV
jgi:hypothetical protein